MNEQESLKEINVAIRDGLNTWADVMLEAEVKHWAYELNYFPRDLMNAIYIFQHVASNIGIKAEIINEQNAEEFGKRLRQLVIDMTGYEPGETLDGGIEYAENISTYHADHEDLSN